MLLLITSAYNFGRAYFHTVDVKKYKISCTAMFTSNRGVSYHYAQGPIQGGRGVHAPPSLACAIFFARGCWRSDIPRSLHPSALSTELLEVSELPHLSLTLTLAQPHCNCKCNLTLTLDSRYNRRHALAWEYQR